MSCTRVPFPRCKKLSTGRGQVHSPHHLCSSACPHREPTQSSVWTIAGGITKSLIFIEIISYIDFLYRDKMGSTFLHNSIELCDPIQVQEVLVLLTASGLRWEWWQQPVLLFQYVTELWEP